MDILEEKLLIEQAFFQSKIREINLNIKNRENKTQIEVKTTVNLLIQFAIL